MLCSYPESNRDPSAIKSLVYSLNYAVAQLVEALCYKSEGRGFDSRGVTGIFHRHNPSGSTMVLGLTQPLTEMSTGNIFWE
jgi:hypothetical protein